MKFNKQRHKKIHALSRMIRCAEEQERVMSFIDKPLVREIKSIRLSLEKRRNDLQQKENVQIAEVK